MTPTRIYSGSPLSANGCVRLPGRAWDNEYYGRFNGTRRREVLDAERFATTRQAWVVLTCRPRQYNHTRPHQALGKRSSVPETQLRNGPWKWGWAAIVGPSSDASFSGRCRLRRPGPRCDAEFATQPTKVARRVRPPRPKPGRRTRKAQLRGSICSRPGIPADTEHDLWRKMPDQLLISDDLAVSGNPLWERLEKITGNVMRDR